MPSLYDSIETLSREKGIDTLIVLEAVKDAILVAARKIYQEAGFKLVATEPHRSFGKTLIGEYWRLKLR